MLSQKLSQKLLQKMSPQQIQLMKLLEIPTASLEQRIKEELEANPTLEEGENESEEISEQEEENDFEEEKNNDEEEVTESKDDIDLSDYLNDEDEIAEYKLKDTNYPDPDEERVIPIASGKSFHDYLEQQLGMLDLNEEQLVLAEQIIGSIDDDGYMRRELEALRDDLAFSQNIETSVEQLKFVLEKIKTLEPAGVGASNLQECLLLQLDRKEEEIETHITNLAREIIENHFEEFIKKHYEKLQQRMEISNEELKPVLNEILKLNPKPGSAFTENKNTAQYVVPDYTLVNDEGELKLSLNSRNAPELRISNSYKEMMNGYQKSKKKDKKQKEAVTFIKQKLDAAQWFIDAIKERQNTLLQVMKTILQLQYDYFLTGDETKMKSMILKDVAEITGLHISTVSRVSNSKYIQTEFGTIPLKYFFSESLSTDSGEEVSSREVKRILKDLVEAEDKKTPLRDDKLTQLLKEKGYNIARRTVAKYRELLNIPVSWLRKEL